jgi:myo-inositol-1(or 4)-monophosphatase
MDIKEVHGWAEEAGRIALHYFNDVEARLKADQSVVTAADEEIEVLLRRRIAAAYPNHAIIGEEQGGAAPGAEYLWALDPIDGTSAFVQGLPIWGISIGLLRHEQPILGCFYLPLLQEWYEAGLEGPATFNGTPIHVAHDNLLDSEAWISVPSDSHRLYSIDYPGKTRSLGSMAASLCYVARGTAAGALLGRPHIWDIAAGLAILRRAGGDVQRLSVDAPVDLQVLLTGKRLPEPFIAGSPPALAMLQARIRLHS